jgi:hypothetical protein
MADVWVWIKAVFNIWLGLVALVHTAEQITERFCPRFWSQTVDRYVTVRCRKRIFIGIAVFAFLWSNFSAFDDERQTSSARLAD